MRPLRMRAAPHDKPALAQKAQLQARPSCPRQQPQQRHGYTHAAARHTHGHPAGRRERLLRGVSQGDLTGTCSTAAERCGAGSTAAAAAAAQVEVDAARSSFYLADTPRAAAAPAHSAAKQSLTRRCGWECVCPAPERHCGGGRVPRCRRAPHPASPPQHCHPVPRLRRWGMSTRAAPPSSGSTGAPASTPRRGGGTAAAAAVPPLLPPPRSRRTRFARACLQGGRDSRHDRQDWQRR